MSDAREEAERRWPLNHIVPDPFGETGEAETDPYGYHDLAQRGSIEGAAWQASRPVMDAQVEAAAVAIDMLDWSQQEHGVTPDSGEIARAALEAARLAGATPDLIDAHGKRHYGEEVQA